MERNDTRVREKRLADQIASEAAEWFARLQDPGASPTDRGEFAQWLLRSPAHIEEYLAVTRIWGDAEAATELSTDELIRQARAEDAADNVVALHSAQTSDGGVATGGARPRTRGALWAVAASIALAVIVGGVATREWFNPSRIETAVGEQRSLTLADGSVVHVNTDSEIRVDLTDDTRRIVLTRGEARFTVAKDPRRPFLVTTPQATVRALGTVFNVHASSDRTAVTVIEGRVAVDQARKGEAHARNGEASRATPASALELAAGQHVEITARGEFLPDAGPSVERVLAWSDRRLVFRDDALADVVAEFNRYHERPIRIEDPALAAVRISGTFDASDPHSLVQYLERYEKVRTREESDGTRYLMR